MAEEQPPQVSTTKKVRQTISVPFVWEVIPGTPRKDWKSTSPPNKPMATPAKLIASVPFGWEEKPGKPFPYYSQPPPSSPLSLPPTESNSYQSPVKQSASVPFEWEEKPRKSVPCNSQPPTASSPMILPKAEISSFQSPVKLIASVPFEWEEKPRKPLPNYTQLPPSSPLALRQSENNSSHLPVKLTASIPFEWADKQGKSSPCCLLPPPASSAVVLSEAGISSFQSPVKLIASVPFEWEEKPGKPLPCFTRPPSTSPLALPQAQHNTFPSLPGHCAGNEANWLSMNGQDRDESEMIESEPETCEYETDDGSFSSAPSFSANSLPPRVAAVPLQQGPLKNINSGELQRPGSPASETESTSSYATVTSLVGASFLEWLFPLLAHSSFLNKVGCSETASQIQPKKQSTDFDRERNYSATIRRPPTLGELIMMSRRRSYQRKAIQMQKQNLSREITKTNASGCCIFGTSNILSRFDIKWKRQLQLKLT